MFLGKQIAKYHVSFQDSLNFTKQLEGGNKNLTGPNKDAAAVEVIPIPPGMSPSEALQKYKPGTRLRLPDGRIGTVP
jgi:hypothetical protein